MSNDSVTVTVGDTEVQIEETEDGFEATEVEDDPEPGVYIRATEGTRNPSCGFEVPIDADFQIEKDIDDDYRATWFDDDNVTDMGGWHAEESDIGDTGAYVGEPEIVIR